MSINKIGVAALAVLIATGCSTQKNTGASRAWHQTKVIHNVQFNGQQAFKEGMDAINQAHADNFATTLPLYPVSDHQAAEASASNMDQAIEKCRKAIKLHSIKARPKVNPKKRNNAKYQNWLKNNEFNNQMWRAWMMLGQSEFHKGDFLGSVGTFRYVEKLYENDPNMVALCNLWVARAYGEMGWIYEAEDVLSKVKIDDLKRKNQSYYSAVSADILMKGQHNKEAIPFVKVAKQDEKRKEYLPRFEYVLGQLYQQTGQINEARGAYKKTYRLHPKDVKMEFNARIHYAELQGDTLKTVKKLRRMAKLYKYRDNLDQLYGTIGNIYLTNGDTVQALDYYEQAIAASTQHADEQAQVQIVAGDLYYDRHDYAAASPCYKGAAQIITTSHPDYQRVTHRSEVLDEVVVETQTVQLQDSLQHLGTLTEEEQRKVVDKIIADLIEKEKQDSIQQAEQDRENELNALGGGLQSVNTSMMIGNRMGEAANWYFYNPQLMRSGKQEFIRKWGNRALEDNWRRLSKATVMSTIEPENYEGDDTLPTDSLALTADSLGQTATPPAPLSTDIHSPEYYLQQIPKTPEDYAASDTLIADALYNLIFLYRDKVNDLPMSNKTWEDFQKRFPNEGRTLDIYYDRYLNALRTNDTDEAELCKTAILTRYPQSSQAKIVSDPNYFTSLRKMAQEEDSMYAATYDAYKHSRYNEVKANTTYVEQNYPLTRLMPRFLFLNAISVAKTEGQKPFTASLQDMVDRYPDNELSAMAKDMLAMMGQGMESKKGGTTSTLTEQRETQVEEPEEAPMLATDFNKERNEQSLVYIAVANDEELLNQVLYEVALYNFTQFLVKDFDLKKVPIFTGSQSALEISGFETLDEAEWYVGLLQDNTDLQLLFKQINAQVIPITETNFKMINHPFSVDEYMRFYRSK